MIQPTLGLKELALVIGVHGAAIAIAIGAVKFLIALGELL